MATGLLIRAVQYGQSFQLYGSFKHSLVEKSLKVPGKKLIEELQSEYDSHAEKEKARGSMTDASKRRYDPEEDDASSASSDWEGLSMISQNSRPLGSAHQSKKYTYSNKNAPLPKDVTFVEWCNSICTLKKIKHLNLTYLELVEKAESIPEIHSYLKWVKQTHGPSSIHYLKGNMTQVMDLAVFLEAVEWTYEDKETSELSFTRQVKK